MVQIIIIFFIHLIVNKLIDSSLNRTRRHSRLTNTLTCAQTRNDKSIGIIIVRILFMDISRPLRVTLPTNRATTIKQNIISVIEPAISLS